MSKDNPENSGNSVNGIIDIIRFMSQTDLNELEVESQDFKLSLRRNERQETISNVVSVPASPVHVKENRPIQKAVVSSVPAAPEKKPEVEIYHKVVSPMVGTFYRAPSPVAPPYTKEGDKITAGQPVCIVEAMKLMNEIKSDVSGRVVKVIAENGQIVEKGSVLFLVDTTS
ncbi:MAG: acetyl-CoA carboxylase biotin carboxyl carrier protein [Candidatus Riflebacteria bacterium]|nr:acetyl-CoA carboxylase biotin carboxyl carrier protein [Candidatus Riflebacteria bacterium]